MKKQKVLLMLSVTRILAVRSWPDSSNCANSLLSCFIWASLLFFKSFMRETASFNAVLLHQTKQNKTNSIQQNLLYHSHWLQSKPYKLKSKLMDRRRTTLQAWSFYATCFAQHTNWRTNDYFDLFMKEKLWWGLVSCWIEKQIN